jgi:hypothetical protein
MQCAATDCSVLVSFLQLLDVQLDALDVQLPACCVLLIVCNQHDGIAQCDYSQSSISQSIMLWWIEKTCTF